MKLGNYAGKANSKLYTMLRSEEEILKQRILSREGHMRAQLLWYLHKQYGVIKMQGKTTEELLQLALQLDDKSINAPETPMTFDKMIGWNDIATPDVRVHTTPTGARVHIVLPYFFLQTNQSQRIQQQIMNSPPWIEFAKDTIDIIQNQTGNGLYNMLTNSGFVNDVLQYKLNEKKLQSGTLNNQQYANAFNQNFALAATIQQRVQAANNVLKTINTKKRQGWGREMQALYYHSDPNLTYPTTSKNGTKQDTRWSLRTTSNPYYDYDYLRDIALDNKRTVQPGHNIHYFTSNPYTLNTRYHRHILGDYNDLTNYGKKPLDDKSAQKLTDEIRHAIFMQALLYKTDKAKYAILTQNVKKPGSRSTWNAVLLSRLFFEGKEKENPALPTITTKDNYFSVRALIQGQSYGNVELIGKY